MYFIVFSRIKLKQPARVSFVKRAFYRSSVVIWQIGRNNKITAILALFSYFIQLNNEHKYSVVAIISYRYVLCLYTTLVYN